MPVAQKHAVLSETPAVASVLFSRRPNPSTMMRLSVAFGLAAFASANQYDVLFPNYIAPAEVCCTP